MAIWTCFTDGGCQGNPGPSAWGAVVLPPDGGAAIEGSGFLGHGTNQIAELSAALHGMAMTPVGAEVLLVSDSQYTLKGLTEWRRGWESKGFRNSKGETVANLSLWKQLYAIADQRRLRTQWVKGHSGHAHNERCDLLAAQAIRTGTGITPAPTPARGPVPSQQALDLGSAAAPGLAWTPVSLPEPEHRTVLYGQVEDIGAGPSITRAETGSRSGALRDKPWATHWMAIPDYRAP